MTMQAYIASLQLDSKLAMVVTNKLTARREDLDIPAIVCSTLTAQTNPIQMTDGVVYDWVASIAAIPKFEKNIELLGHLNYMPKRMRACEKKMYKTGKRCTECFALHNGECMFPAYYNLTPIQWKSRCIICHEQKIDSTYHLCGSIVCAMSFMLITNPPFIQTGKTHLCAINWV